MVEFIIKRQYTMKIPEPDIFREETSLKLQSKDTNIIKKFSVK